jgi:hypothetical protein
MSGAEKTARGKKLIAWGKANQDLENFQFEEWEKNKAKIVASLAHKRGESYWPRQTRSIFQSPSQRFSFENALVLIVSLVILRGRKSLSKKKASGRGISMG